MVSELASREVKVVLGGQGGDEIFGGYARYLIAYLEQSLKASIDGTYKNGNFVVTPQSIIPNLTVLQEYKPLLRQFFSKGLFGPINERYFRLIDRSADMTDEVDWSALDFDGVFARFDAIFSSERNVRKEAYFDSMTHFDFKCLLPALLQVEDRMSMAHGLESRVPFLDHRVVEFAATIPADIKFKDGRMKQFIKSTFSDRPAAGTRGPTRQDGFSGAVEGMVWRRVARLPVRYFRDAEKQVASVFQHGCNSLESGQGRTLLAQDMGPSQPRALASDVSRPGSVVQDADSRLPR